MRQPLLQRLRQIKAVASCPRGSYRGWYVPSPRHNTPCRFMHQYCFLRSEFIDEISHRIHCDYSCAGEKFAFIWIGYLEKALKWLLNCSWNKTWLSSSFYLAWDGTCYFSFDLGWRYWTIYWNVQKNPAFEAGTTHDMEYSTCFRMQI